MRRLHWFNLGRLTIEIYEKYDESKFSEYIQRLQRIFGAEVIEEIEGLDQRYLDFRVGDKILVLQSDIYMGISIHFEDLADETKLRKIGKGIKDRS